MPKAVKTAIIWLTIGWFVLAGFIAYTMYLVIEVSEINLFQDSRLQRLERSHERT